MKTVVVELLEGDEVADLCLASLEQRMAALRSTRSRIDGQEATLAAAARRLRETARKDARRRAGADGGAPPPSPEPPGPSPLPLPDPTPGPSSREQRRIDARARRLEQYPEVARALEAGEINTEQADAITMTMLPHDVVAGLLSGARCQTTDETLEAVRQAKLAAQRGDAQKRYRRQRDARRGRHGTNDSGMYWFNNEFDPVVGSKIKQIVDAEVRQEWQRDKDGPKAAARTPQQIEADALARLFLGDDLEELHADIAAAMGEPAPATPTGRGGRSTPRRQSGGTGAPRVNVTLTLDDLRHADDRTRRAFSDDGVPVPASIVQRLLDDAEILLWVTDDQRKHYQLLRASRLASPIQRQALAIRDGCCVWRGCTREPGLCDAHHLIHRSEGGVTGLDNLALLCPTHHRALHRMGAHLQMAEGPGAWRLVQDHTGRVLDEWVNPPPPGAPRPKGRAGP